MQEIISIEELEFDDVINDKWLIPENKLDEIQYKILNNDEEKMCVSGGAGSGKTILAIYRLAKIIKENKGSYSFIVYTLALKEFIKTGIEEIESEYYSYDTLRNINIFHVNEVENLIRNNKFESVDYIIIDEVQDLKPEFIDSLKKYINKGLLVLGDDKQQLYSEQNNNQTINDIRKVMDIPNYYEIEKNYRVPKEIAKFAGKIINDSGELAERCVKDFGYKPKIIKKKNYKDQLDNIINIIEEEEIKDAAILVPYNTQVKKVKEYYDKQNKEVEVKYRLENENEKLNTLDFSSELPKVMTYHSSKGLEFDYIFLPMSEENDRSENYDMKNALYVACTRAKKRLYIFYSYELNTLLK